MVMAPQLVAWVIAHLERMGTGRTMPWHGCPGLGYYCYFWIYKQPRQQMGSSFCDGRR